MNSLACALMTCSSLTLLESCVEAPAENVEWDGRVLREVRNLSRLPPALQTALGSGRPGLGGIADRDGKFNVTDVGDSRLPMRRFVVAGLEGDTALVAVELGGRGRGVDVTFFSDTGGKVVIGRRWALFDRPPPRTLRALVYRLGAPTR